MGACYKYFSSEYALLTAWHIIILYRESIDAWYVIDAQGIIKILQYNLI